jgi:N-acetylneuraminic acid mutarotase
MRSSVERASAALVMAIVVAGCGAGPGRASPTPFVPTPVPSDPTPFAPAASPTVDVAPSQSPGVGGIGWSPTGTLAETRVGHTATLLADGRVLVAGGFDIEGAEALSVEVMRRTSAEVYDPVSGTWSATGSMAVGRASHTATRLPDGTVLVTGGGEADEMAAGTAELYDPATGRWTDAGRMAAVRFDHTAFLLPSGTVLVVGGRGLGSDPLALASAERYDPVTHTWTAAASLEVASFGQVGTSLLDGRALLIQGSFDASARTWILDPAVGTWIESGSMGQPRHGFPLALLPNGAVLAPGGGIGRIDGVLATVQVFDPASGTWQEVGSMSLQRHSFTAVALRDGRVVAIGGGGADDAGARSAEIYDPATGGWSPAGSMVDPRYSHTATLLADGSILVVGGYKGARQEALDTAERYLPPAS